MQNSSSFGVMSFLSIYRIFWRSKHEWLTSRYPEFRLLSPNWSPDCSHNSLSVEVEHKYVYTHTHTCQWPTSQPTYCLTQLSPAN